MASLHRVARELWVEGGSEANGQPAGLSDDGCLEMLRKGTLPKRFPRLAEVGEAATLIASDRAAQSLVPRPTSQRGHIVD